MKKSELLNFIAFLNLKITDIGFKLNLNFKILKNILNYKLILFKN